MGPRLAVALILAALAPAIWAGSANAEEAPEADDIVEREEIEDPEALPEIADRKVISRRGARLYPEERRIEVDGEICLDEGPIELLACARGGKEYESIIALDLQPSDLHMFLLALGLKPAPADAGPRFQGDPEHAPSGDPVNIYVRFETEDGPKTYRSEDLVWNQIDQRLMCRTHYVFLGSRFVQEPQTGREIYWANRELSVVTVFRDPMSVLDLPLEIGADDRAFVVNTDVVPPVGTEVTLIIKPAELPEPPPKNEFGGQVIHMDITRGGRVLLNEREPMFLLDTLRDIRDKEGEDSLRITIDHGAPPDAIYRAFDAIHRSGIQVESLETVRLKEDLEAGLTAELQENRIQIDGARVTAQELATLWQEGDSDKGFSVIIDEDTTALQLAEVFHAIQEAEPAETKVIEGATHEPLEVRTRDHMALRLDWNRGPLARRDVERPARIERIHIHIGVSDGHPAQIPPVTVTLSESDPSETGDLIWLRERLTYIAGLRRTADDVQVTIQPEPATLYRWVVRVVDLCNELGWSDARLLTRPPEPDTE